MRVIETLESNEYPKSFVQSVDKRRTKKKIRTVLMKQGRIAFGYLYRTCVV